MWVITRAINEYYQDGDYFVACYKNKPSFEEFVKVVAKSEGWRENHFDEVDEIERVRRYYENKGRFSNENSWYFLSEIKEGEVYQRQFSEN